MKIISSVCAVVVTFNRKNLLLQCIDALLGQKEGMEAIFIVDNASSDGTPELLRSNGFLPEWYEAKDNEESECQLELGPFKKDSRKVKIFYTRLAENTGGAGGFSVGIEKAFSHGYDWMWVMDDDAICEDGALKELRPYMENSGALALATSVLTKERNVDLNHRGRVDFKYTFPLLQRPLERVEYEKEIVPISTASFVGFMISRKAVDIVGLPRKEFFIHHDDVEYSLRISDVGPVFLVPSSRIIHMEAAHKKVGRVNYSDYWIKYYGIRNHIFLAKKRSASKFYFYSGLCLSFLRAVAGVLLYDDCKVKRLNFLFNAYFDGLKGVFNNKKPKELLYGNR